MRYELTDHEWAAMKPMLPNKPRGVPKHQKFYPAGVSLNFPVAGRGRPRKNQI